MATRFVGRFEHSLDGKGRVILPVRFRAAFESLALVSQHEEECLAIWTPEAFDRKSEEMIALMDGSPEDRAKARSWASGSQEADLDRQGRVAIPAHLRAFAQLQEGSTVLVHGALTHIELWNPQLWQAQEAVGAARFGGRTTRQE